MFARATTILEIDSPLSLDIRTEIARTEIAEIARGETKYCVNSLEGRETVVYATPKLRWG